MNAIENLTRRIAEWDAMIAPQTTVATAALAAYRAAVLNGDTAGALAAWDKASVASGQLQADQKRRVRLISERAELVGKTERQEAFDRRFPSQP